MATIDISSDSTNIIRISETKKEIAEDINTDLFAVLLYGLKCHIGTLNASTLVFLGKKKTGLLSKKEKTFALTWFRYNDELNFTIFYDPSKERINLSNKTITDFFNKLKKSENKTILELYDFFNKKKYESGLILDKKIIKKIKEIKEDIFGDLIVSGIIENEKDTFVLNIVDKLDDVDENQIPKIIENALAFSMKSKKIVWIKGREENVIQETIKGVYDILREIFKQKKEKTQSILLKRKNKAFFILIFEKFPNE